MSKIKPIGKRLLVFQPEFSEHTTDSGIIVCNEKDLVDDRQFKVVAVGKGMKEPVEVGDTIIVQPYAGITVEIDNVPHLIILGDNVMGVIK